MTLKFFPQTGHIICARLTVRGHTFGLNVWGKGTYGVREVIWFKHWGPEPEYEPFARPWGDQ